MIPRALHAPSFDPLRAQNLVRLVTTCSTWISVFRHDMDESMYVDHPRLTFLRYFS